jgi:hypothetical protein
LQAQATTTLACDFLTVETIFLQRIYVLFFISLATRRIEYVACGLNPDGRWVTQQARNLAMQFGDEQSFRFLIHGGYRRHYNEHRPHRALQLLPPNGRDPTPRPASTELRQRDVLGGLIHEYEAA